MMSKVLPLVTWNRCSTSNSVFPRSVRRPLPSYSTSIIRKTIFEPRVQKCFIEGLKRWMSWMRLKIKKRKKVSSERNRRRQIPQWLLPMTSSPTPSHFFKTFLGQTWILAMELFQLLRVVKVSLWFSRIFAI
jgi:hypothetical protein